MSKKSKVSSKNKKTSPKKNAPKKAKPVKAKGTAKPVKKVVKKSAPKKAIAKKAKPAPKKTAAKTLKHKATKKLIKKVKKALAANKKKTVAKKPAPKKTLKKVVKKTAPKKVAKPVKKAAKPIAKKVVVKAKPAPKKSQPLKAVAPAKMAQPLKPIAKPVAKPAPAKTAGTAPAKALAKPQTAKPVPKPAPQPKPIVMPPTYRKPDFITNAKPMKEPAGKFEIEFVIRSSAEMLYEFLSTPSGLSEWFCDDVNIRNGIYSFVWDGQEQQALLVKDTETVIRFQWIDKNDGSYFEFRIQKDELTNDISLMITDFASDRHEEESIKLLWRSQIDKLLHVLGSYF